MDKRVWIADRSKHQSYKDAVKKAKVSKRTPPGRWRVHWIDPDGKERNKTFQVLGDAAGGRVDTANGFKRKLERELNGDMGSIYIDPNAGDTPFGVLIDSWQASCDEVKRSSLQKYDQVIKTHIRPRWAPVPVRLMSAMVIAPWLARLKKGGGETTIEAEKLGASQKRMVFTVMNAILDWATPEFLPSNPMRDRKKIKRPKPKRIHDHCYLDYLEVEALADAADGLVGAYGRLKAGAEAGVNGTLIRTLAYTGMRPGEALAMRVGLVDRDARRPTLAVRRTLIEDGSTAEIYEDVPKDHEARTVPLPLSLLPDIERLCAGKGDDDYLFAIKGGPVRLRNWRPREFYAARDAIGLPAGLTPHKLRHTAASLAIRAKATPLSVQKLLGHASASETLNTYAHLWDSEIWAVAETLDRERQRALVTMSAMEELAAVVADLAGQLADVRSRLERLESYEGSEALHRELEQLESGRGAIDEFLRDVVSNVDIGREAVLAGAG
ncbi:tyrosine-type recombinase/integrase [Glycomyces tarimensis]